MCYLTVFRTGIGYGSRGLYTGQAPYPGMYPAGAAQGGGDSQETTYLYIPNNAVGAIIGTKGSHIRNIIRFSGASVKIAPIDETKPQETQNERRVTIVGSPEAQWKVNSPSRTVPSPNKMLSKKFQWFNYTTCAFLEENLVRYKHFGKFSMSITIF
jgi:hypothetical protein